MMFQLQISDECATKARKMDWRELLDRCCCPNFNSQADIPNKEYGAVFFHPDKKDVLYDKISRYKKQCETQPLVCADLECGPGFAINGLTAFPSMMGCSRSGDSRLNYEMGKITAMEAREVGYNWTFAPVADILTNLDNPITNVRACGRDKDTVIAYAGAYMRGLQDHGMVATLKHFPGDGYDKYDQHLTTTYNPLSREEWFEQSGAVFKTLIEQGVMSIMPGHIGLRSIDPSGYPATLSKILLTDLLRGELKFDGIIMSDAIEMGGFTNIINFHDACARFWESGGDCLLFSPRNERFYNEMKKRIDNGKLKLETLEYHAARMMAFREFVAELDAKIPIEIDKTRHKQVSDTITENAVELFRDRNNILPYKKNNAKIAHIIFDSCPIEWQNLKDAMTEMLKKHGQVTVIEDMGPDYLRDHIEEYDLAVVSVLTGCCWATGSARLYGPTARNMMCGWMKYGVPTVFVSHQNPFLYLEFEHAMDTVINAHVYNNSTICVPFIEKHIFGE